jgi:polyisoprenoid-binding protein YceI
MIRSNPQPKQSRAKLQPFGILLATTIAFGLSATIAAPRAYTVAKTPEASAEFNFRVTLIPVPGTVKAVEAQLRFDPSDLSKVSGTVSVDLSKLETGIGLRDQHAKDALGVERQPKAVFTITRFNGAKSLVKGTEQKATAVGSFSLNGIKTPLEAPVTLNFDGTNLAVKAIINITLSDHKINVTGADATVDVTTKFTLTPNP